MGRLSGAPLPFSLPPCPSLDGRGSQGLPTRPRVECGGPLSCLRRRGREGGDRDPRSPLRVTALAAAMAMRQTPLTCSGHTRPVVDLAFSGITPYGYFLISACKGELSPRRPRLPGAEGWVGRSCRLKRLRCCNSGFCSPLAKLYVFLFTTVFSACAFLHTQLQCIAQGFTGRRN